MIISKDKVQPLKPNQYGLITKTHDGKILQMGMSEWDFNHLQRLVKTVYEVYPLGGDFELILKNK